MITPEIYKAVKTQIIAALINQDWQVARVFDVEHTYHCATRDYQTATGVKTATVALENHGDTLVLAGVYESEGRNVLSTSNWFGVPTEATVEEYAKGVEGFCIRADNEINQSYARRLHLNSFAPLD